MIHKSTTCKLVPRKFLIGGSIDPTTRQLLLGATYDVNDPIVRLYMETHNQPKNNLDIYHRFNNKNFDEFTLVLMPIIMDSLNRHNYPTAMALNILRLAALESAYGTSPRGERGYNLGGIKWYPEGGTSKYNHTTYSGDGIEYVDFDNLSDYMDYKVQLLNNTYDALNAANTNDFVERLHKKNPRKKSYSKRPDVYMKTLNGTKSLDRAYNRYIQNNK